MKFNDPVEEDMVQVKCSSCFDTFHARLCAGLSFVPKKKAAELSRLFFPDCLLKSNSLQVHVKKINFLYYENLSCPEAYGLFNFDIKPRDRHKPIGQFC